MSGQVFALPIGRQVSLEDRYVLDEGEVFLTGVQACVRVLIDQHRADTAAGLHTATLASGYPGSPLAGLDRELERLGPLAAEHDIVLRRAINEELAATAVYGSQLTNTLPGTNVGTCRARSSCSEALGTVEETQAGSSPHRASTPP